MKTIAILFAAVMIFAGCSARQDDMMSDVQSNVSSALQPDKSSSSQMQEGSSGSGMGSEESSAIGAGSGPSDGTGSESEPMLNSEASNSAK